MIAFALYEIYDFFFISGDKMIGEKSKNNINAVVILSNTNYEMENLLHQLY